jgi:citrate lyase beta subunit
MRQHARADYERRRVLAHVTTNGPGLVLVRIRDAHTERGIAQIVAPAFTAGTTTVRIPLTRTGRRVLRRGHSLRVTAGVAFRDVLTAHANGVITGRLR